MKNCASGDVLHGYIRFTKPPKNKFLLCICPNELLFFFINSDPPSIEANAGFKLTPRHLACLSHVSYVNTAALITLKDHGINHMTRKGKIPLSLCRQMVNFAEAHGVLPEQHVQRLKTAFPPDAPP